MDAKHRSRALASVSVEDVATTVVFRETASFAAPDGKRVRLGPGAYRVVITGDERLALVDAAGEREIPIAAARTWHEFELASPLALPYRDPQDGHQKIVVLLPGGLAFLSHTDPGSSLVASVPKPVVLDVLLKWLPYIKPKDLPVNENLLGRLSTIGKIDPASPATAFAIMTGYPPNWIGSEIIESFAGTPPRMRSVAKGAPVPTPGVPPGGSPGVVFHPAPGSVTWDHYISTATVTVDSSLSMVGHILQLRVTHFVDTVGDYGAYSRVKDFYHQIPSIPGPVTFTGVIVAAGLAPSFPPPPGPTWVQQITDRYKAPAGGGAPVDFEVYLNAIRLGERHCRFNSAGPIPTLSCS